MDPLEKLKYLEAHATPGPWEGAEYISCGYRFLDSVSCVDYDGAMRPQDGRFISAIRNIAPELIALWEAANTWNRDEDTVFYAPLDNALDALNAKANTSIILNELE